jgi:hypothetical protein
MINQSTAVVLAALIGGLMAIIAGLIANLFIIYKENSREKRKEIREILETIYRLTAVINFHSRQATLGPTQMDEAVHAIPEKLAEIGMRVRLYAPNLKDKYEKYRESISRITDLILMLKNGDIHGEQYVQELITSEKVLMEFRKTIEELIRSKGYRYFK